MVRRLMVVLALAVTVGLLVEGSPALASMDPGAAETEFVWHINHLREEQGLPLLTVDPGLTAVARQWAATMAAEGGIRHRTNLSTVAPDPNWVKIGENVGVGVGVSALHDAFVASPSHYANLVDSKWQRVGVGVVMVGDTIFVAENFMQVEAPKAVAKASRAKAAKKRPAKSAARKPAARKKTVRK